MVSCKFNFHSRQLYFLLKLFKTPPCQFCTKMSEMSDLYYLQKLQLCFPHNYVTSSLWNAVMATLLKQECIPVGCLQPSSWPYASMHFAGGGCLPGGSASGLVPGAVCHWSGGGGVSASGPGCVCIWSRGRGCITACNGADTPCGQTDTCENITFAGVNKGLS